MPPCASAQGTVQQTVQQYPRNLPRPLGRSSVQKSQRCWNPAMLSLAQKLAPLIEESSPAAREEPAISPAEAAIYRQFGRFSEVSTDGDRAKLIVDLALQVRTLPPDAAKLDLARILCGTVSEGDMGQEISSGY